MCTHVSYAYICARCTVDDVAEVYLAAKRAYYAGTPIMSDPVFDYIEQRLRERAPGHTALQQVGSDHAG